MAILSSSNGSSSSASLPVRSSSTAAPISSVLQDPPTECFPPTPLCLVSPASLSPTSSYFSTSVTSSTSTAFPSPPPQSPPCFDLCASPKLSPSEMRLCGRLSTASTLSSSKSIEGTNNHNHHATHTTLVSPANSPTPKQSGFRSKKKGFPTPNDWWKEYLKHIEPFLDIDTILNMRCCCVLFYLHKYKPYNSTLSFLEFAGFCPKIVVESVLPVACRAVSQTVRESLQLDFSCNTLFKDASVARLMDAVHGDKNNNSILGNLRSLNLRFCYLITDKGLAALLSTYLPYLQELKLGCARSKQLTGLPFSSELSEERWPSFCELDCSFTNIWLEPVEHVAQFVTHVSEKKGTKPKLEIFGSWASRCLFEKLGQGSVYKAFCEAVKNENSEAVAKLTKLMQKEFPQWAEYPDWSSYPLIQLLRNSGSELLTNVPLTVNTDEPLDTGSVTSGGVDVWTLPITTAIQKQDHATFNVLLKRGAIVDVWDYLGKSPVCRACEVQRGDFLEVLIEQGASPKPHDLSGQSPLDISIKKKNVDIIRILLKYGASLNHRCPALRQYKSPLYVACEVTNNDTSNSEIVQLFLEAGADPNWKSYTKFTPTMLAYQLNGAWLPHFIEAGAGTPIEKRWVLTEVLGCAIMKNDLESAKTLCSSYPDLINRAHPMWSKPHIQASKLGKFETLQYLLSKGADVNARGDTGQTALLDAAEEGFVACVELLLDNNADINSTDQDGRNALHIACLENRADIAELLLRRSGGRCGVNARDKLLGETPLMICLRTRNATTADMIIKYAQGIECDIVDNQGRSALTYAMFFGQYSVADFLMANGADVTITDDAGNSPYTVVCERMLTQGSDKRVLKKYLRLYKAKGRKHRRRPLPVASPPPSSPAAPPSLPSSPPLRPYVYV
eukprot:GHVQ01042766.1.p1 GENE.GHVQ01042766.1~~GHVQ01042766.1.p1  ORF type:complete len:900 (-),score=120.62 GHVQ01042766.1:3983-6682(-)